MSNPYDQFDAPAPQAAPPQPAAVHSNPYDQFDPPPDSGWTLGSLAKQVPVGANEALADALGAPADAWNWARGKLGLGHADEPLLGSQMIKQGLGLIGANPDASPARNAGERIARGVGAGAASMVLPEAAVGAAGRAGLAAVAPRVAETLGDTFGSASSAGGLASNAAVGGISGAGGQAASEVVPDRYKPIASMAGSLGAGAVGALGASVPTAAKLGVQAAKDYVMPLTDAGQEALAGAKIASVASDPAAVRNALEDMPPDLVPGSKPTTFQLTGDMGLGALEQVQANKNPGLFNQRRADQNTARLDALGGIQPTGDPADVSKLFNSQLADLDALGASYENAARQQAQDALGRVGGTDTPEAIGNALRGTLADSRAAAKERETALWNAVDPDGTLANSMTGIKQAADNIYGNLPKADAANLAGPENTFRSLVQGYRPVEPFSELQSLRSNLSQAMRDELTANGRSPAYARMSQLMDAVQGTISNTIEGQAAQQAHAVSTGAMAPEDSMAAMLSKMAAERDSFLAEKSVPTARAGAGRSDGSNGSIGSSSVFGAPGAQSQGRGGLGVTSGDPGLQANAPLVPNFDQAAVDRLKAASGATKDRAQTFDSGPVGTILRNQGTAGNYKMLDANVPDAVFKPGPDGAQVAQSYFKAAGNDPEALDTFHDAAALKMRKEAVVNGVVDPAKLASFQAKYADAFRAVPGLNDQFSTAAKASETLANIAALRKQAIDQYQAGAVGKMMGQGQPDKVVGSIIVQKDGPAQMRRLAQKASADPNAMEGLRKAVVDHMLSKLVSNTEAATSGSNLLRSDQLQSYIRQNRLALKQVFSDPEVGLMQAIADDLHRANRSNTAVRLPAGSDTAQKLAAMAKEEPGKQTSLLTKIMAGAGSGAGAGAPFGLYPVGAAIGAGGAVGQHIIGAMREAGMRKVSDLVRDAMLNPDLARALLAKAPIVKGRGSEVSLAQQLRRVGMFSASDGMGLTRSSE